MGGNTGNIRTPRLSSTGGSRTYMSMIANSNSSIATCGSNKRVYGYWRCFVNNNINEFYLKQFGLTYGEFASRPNYSMGR